MGECLAPGMLPAPLHATARSCTPSSPACLWRSYTDLTVYRDEECPLPGFADDFCAGGYTGFTCQVGAESGCAAAARSGRGGLMYAAERLHSELRTQT